jgi:hypothetical protein
VYKSAVYIIRLSTLLASTPCIGTLNASKRTYAAGWPFSHGAVHFPDEPEKDLATFRSRRYNTFYSYAPIA